MFNENDTKDLLEDIARAPSKITNIMERESLQINDLEDPMQKLVMTLYSTIVTLSVRARGIIDEDSVQTPVPQHYNP